MSELVESLFRRLATRYGSAWTSKWAGIPAQDVMADWAHVIGGFQPDAIRYALEHLPEFVPTAHQFREICLKQPLPEHRPLALDGPPPTPEQKQRVRELLAQTRRNLTRRHA